MMPSRTQPARTVYDAVVVGSGHNGLVAAAYLAAAGHAVLVLEQNDSLGGATASQQVFPDYDAWLSRYAYLISLLSPQIVSELRLDFNTRQRSVASFTPYRDASGADQGLLMSNVDPSVSRESVLQLTNRASDGDGLQSLMGLCGEMAALAWPTVLEPLRSRSDFAAACRTAGQREAWRSFVDAPLGEVIERYIQNDLLRGVVMTDGKIGVFTHPHDPSLIQNRCFLYHVIGGGTGQWHVPIGGMRSLVDALVGRCQDSGAELHVGATATRVSLGATTHCVEFKIGDSTHQVDATHVLINAGPRTFSRLLNQPLVQQATDEGSVMKMNVLLKRLPKLKASDVDPKLAFAGTLHLDEGYDQMQHSYEQAQRGEVPSTAPAESYCHTLTDDSILSPKLRAAGFQTLTLFGLDMPYRLFAGANHDARRDRVMETYLEGLDRICAEPFIDCVARDRDGAPCIEIKTPQDLEREVGLDLGNIFHNSLSWFFTDDAESVGTWGVETEHPRVYRAGSSAARGGAVSGIPGRNAAMCILGKR